MSFRGTIVCDPLARKTPGRMLFEHNSEILCQRFKEFVKVIELLDLIIIVAHNFLTMPMSDTN
jgi:hypothetical protein